MLYIVKKIHYILKFCENINNLLQNIDEIASMYLHHGIAATKTEFHDQFRSKK